MYTIKKNKGLWQFYKRAPYLIPNHITSNTTYNKKQPCARRRAEWWSYGK